MFWLQLVAPDTGRDGGVLALGVDDEGGAAVAQQGRDDDPRALPGPRAGDDERVMFRCRADGSARGFERQRAASPGALLLPKKRPRARHASSTHIQLGRRVVRRAVDVRDTPPGSFAGAQNEQIDSEDAR